jgi:IclR family acetate operon transcriptional repressor
MTKPPTGEGTTVATDKPAAKQQTTTRRRGRKPSAGGRSVAQVQSLNRGLALLERIADNAEGVTLTDIAQQVGLAPSTAHRLLLTLAQSGFVRQNEELGKWYVGVKAFTVGNAFLGVRDIVETSRPFLHKLMESSGETANLAVLEEGEAVIVSQVECHELMRMVVPLGTRTPVHASGVGKALLSAVTEFEVAAILHRHGLTRYTEHTLDTPAKLKQNLEQARDTGYAVDDEEHAVGLRCVAAPVYDEQGKPVAAISISGPRSRIPDARLRELGTLTRQIAQDITTHIGGRPPPRS